MDPKLGLHLGLNILFGNGVTLKKKQFVAAFRGVFSTLDPSMYRFKETLIPGAVMGTAGAVLTQKTGAFRA